MAIGALLKMGASLVKKGVTKLLKPVTKRIFDPLWRKMGIKKVKDLAGKAVSEGVEAGAGRGFEELLKTGAEKGSAYVTNAEFLSEGQHKKMAQMADSVVGQVEKAKKYRDSANLLKSRAIALAEL